MRYLTDSHTMKAVDIWGFAVDVQTRFKDRSGFMEQF